ncbi:sulfatase [Stieleria sp. JC731]|uniref:sulfatase family protein n=1 Tax=Pirellulaceae TaxID=2691357 RepID=UPI001E644077|nr:sulfatase [Stieleria sp. JC731]MCC9603810.1 sulfatase [Stieleria sp. JC731]
MRYFLSAALLLLSVCTESVCTAEANQRPDIIVYLADDLSQLDISVYSDRGVKTPALEALAAEGMTFDQAFVASPSCAPSRAALLTGLMPARNGAEENHSFPGKDIYRLPNTLKDLGYQVAAFGKVAHATSAPRFGFEVVEGAKEMPRLLQNVTKFLGERTDSRPLALFVGIANPHVPWPSRSSISPEKVHLPPTFVDTPRTRVQRSRYLQEVKDLDKLLASLRTLTRKHLEGEPIYLFSSDHGAQFPLGKWTLYEEGIRVPLIVSWPGHIEPKSRTDAMVSWIDLLPTLIELSGGQPPSDIDGKSFSDVLLGKANSHRDLIFTTHSGDRQMNVYPIRSVRSEDFKYIRNPHPEFAFTTHIDLLLRENSGDYFIEWKELAKSDPKAAAAIARHHGRPAEELYDLRSDPYEQNNLIGNPEYQSQHQDLSATLDQWLKDQGDQLTVFHEPLLLNAPETWVPRGIKLKK